jgi:hypothetical protein
LWILKTIVDATNAAPAHVSQSNIGLTSSRRRPLHGDTIMDVDQTNPICI